ncbi:3658_t:CDS:2 [Gigaspora margarita]|uniref:3658_t:CDS:1 n=1 Tax=Gigaspora margarita TaxID=4874 RepID=A0ABN7UJS8_GIGMA|nr:3658_t:CDS:2 [Gigaspora margarita]
MYNFVAHDEEVLVYLEATMLTKKINYCTRTRKFAAYACELLLLRRTIHN